MVGEISLETVVWRRSKTITYGLLFTVCEFISLFFVIYKEIYSFVFFITCFKFILFVRISSLISDNLLIGDVYLKG